MVAFSVFTKSLGRTWRSQDVFIPLKVKRKVVAFGRCFSKSESHIVKSSYPPIELPQMPLHDFVFEKLHQWENKIAIECGMTGKKMTYKDFYTHTKALAHSLQKKFKMRKGDCQLIMLPNCPEYPSIFMAGSMIGAVTTTSNPLYSAYEISHQIDLTDPRVIFAVPETHGACMEVLNKLKKQIPIVIVRFAPSISLPPGTVDFKELIDFSTPVSLDPVNHDISATAVVPFSSGTSGLPKGVELTHKNVTANLAQIRPHNYYKENDSGETDQCTCLAVLPMFHIYGMVAIAFDSIASGDRLITLPKFEPKIFVETIYTKKIALLHLVPSLVFFLANQPLVEEKHLRSVRYVITGAAPCGALDVEALKKKTPQTFICQGYGMTETSPAITFCDRERKHKTRSVGHPINLTEVKIADLETGKPVPRGTAGEIRVKGPQVMKGYLKRPQITQESFDSDGWLKTGDVGYFDEEDDLYVSDRIKELIKVKGYQVAPAEIEEILRSHPKIDDAGVVGHPHATLGEVPKAFIKVKPGATLTKEEVKDFIKKKLAPYKQLEGGVEFIEVIPRNSAGKILRKELVKMNKNSK